MNAMIYKKKGPLVLFLVLVALGLPLLAGGRGGLGVFASPTVGFLVGWIVAAFVIGWATERIGAPYSLLAGLAIPYPLAEDI